MQGLVCDEILRFMFHFFFFGSEGNLDAPLKHLTPIAEMFWIITDTQLAELRNNFHKDVCISVQKQNDVARSLNIMPEIVPSWLEHMKNTYNPGWAFVKSRRSCENEEVL